MNLRIVCGLALAVALVVVPWQGPAADAKSISGTRKGEELVGSKRADVIRGRGGGDVLVGRSGDDRLVGNGGRDEIYGGLGDDTIVGGNGRDLIFGGPGDDTIRVRGGGRDVVYCGPGDDTVRADRRDSLVDCETALRRPGTRTNPVPLGSPAEVDGWRFVVENYVPDALSLIRSRDEGATPPKAGHRYIVARLSATRIADTSADLDAELLRLQFNVVGESNVAYSALTDGCDMVLTPDPLGAAEVFPGGTITGNICWEVRAQDADGRLVVWYDEFDTERIFMELN